jgi:YVTN family beta-propeller protein
MRRGVLTVGLLLLSQPVLAFSNDLGVLDTASNQFIATIPSPYNTDVKISPDGTRGYLAREGSSDVLLFNAMTDSPIGAISLPDDSEAVAFTPDSRLVFVASQWSGLVSVIDVQRQTVINTISLPAWPLAFSPDGSRAYGGRWVIDTATQTVVDTLPVGGWFMAVSPDGSELYISQNNAIGIVSTADDSLLATINVPNGNPNEIVFSPSGTYAYVAGGSLLVQIDTSTRAVINTAPLPGMRLAVTPDGRRLYHLGAKQLSVVNPSDLSVVNAFVFGDYDAPVSIALSPDGRKLYIASTCVGLC